MISTACPSAYRIAALVVGAFGAALWLLVAIASFTSRNADSVRAISASSIVVSRTIPLVDLHNERMAESVTHEALA